MSRPCLDCGRLAAGTRCTACQRAKEAARPAYRRAYADPAYRAAKAASKGQRCHICGLPGSDTLDHLTPLAAGGPNVSDNWAPAHRSCNSSKGAW